ncbi:MAG: glycosyltransferase family 4 protein [Thermonemataceae bacterium]|nr:glycosyltransferase family 4 protein [Thermonemataceae bacterium]
MLDKPWKPKMLDKPMKILYLHQYFRNPEEAGSHRSWYIAQALQKAGHHIELVTAWSGKKYKKEQLEGIVVHYLPVSYQQNMFFWRRLIAFLSFFMKAFFLALRTRYDKIYATSTPLSIGFLAFLLKKIKKNNYIFEVRDLWPLVPIEMGFIKNNFLKKILFFLERKVYENAEKIVVLSPTMQKYVEEKVPFKEVVAIPNMSDCDFFQPIHKPHIRFRILYFGSIGLANKVEDFVELAVENPYIDFFLAGEGSHLAFILEKAKNLSNFSYLGKKNKVEIKELLQEIDAFFVSFANYKSLETSSPNKFFDGIAAGKMCITQTKGWLKELIEQEKCGFYVANSQEFAEKIRNFLENEKKLLFYQNNARKVAEKYFEKNKLCTEIVNLFDRNTK